MNNYFKFWSTSIPRIWPAEDKMSGRQAELRPRFITILAHYDRCRAGKGCRDCSRTGLHQLSHAFAIGVINDPHARAGHSTLRELRPVSLSAACIENRGREVADDPSRKENRKPKKSLQRLTEQTADLGKPATCTVGNSASFISR